MQLQWWIQLTETGYRNTSNRYNHVDRPAHITRKHGTVSVFLCRSGGCTHSFPVEVSILGQVSNLITDIAGLKSSSSSQQILAEYKHNVKPAVRNVFHLLLHGLTSNHWRNQGQIP